MFLFLVLIYFQKLEGAADDSILVQLVILNSQFAIFIAAITGSIRQIKHQNFYLKKTILLGSASAFTAIIASFFIKIGTWYNKEFFLLLFSLAMIPLLLRFIPKKKKTAMFEVKELNSSNFILTGILAGIGAALSGLGGGFIINPILHGKYRLHLKQSFSLALGSMILTSTSIIIYYLVTNSIKVNLPLAFNGLIFSMLIPIIAGVLVGTPIGIHYSNKANPKILKFIFLIFALIIIVRNLFLIF